MAKGYTSVDLVQGYLGRTLSIDQEAQADLLLPVAEAYIDRITRKPGGWATAPITGEQYSLLRPTIYLKSRPVASVQQIRIRTRAVGDTIVTLTAGSPGVPGDYELIDPNLGQIVFTAGYGDIEPGFMDPTWTQDLYSGAFVASVDYTPVSVIPSDISRAATLIVAHSMMLSIFPGRLGVSGAQVDDQIRISYTQGNVTVDIPPEARLILVGDDRVPGYQNVIIA